MGSLLYVRLIGFTAGTLLMLFWMVVILGYRRQRNFERVFFFLCLALFLFYSGSLLALNAQIYYAEPPPLLTTVAWTVLCLGLIFLSPLTVHLHLEYAETRSLLSGLGSKRLWLAAAYVPAFYVGLGAYRLFASGAGFDFSAPSHPFGRSFELWIAACLWFSAYWQHRFAKVAPDRRQSLFHRVVFIVLFAASLIFLARLIQPLSAHFVLTSSILAFLPILPFAALIYYVQRFNFLQIGRQQNLLYAVSATFLALLYLSLVRRVGLWLEPILPPEASAAILLFVLVIFVEPIQRILRRRLHETARREMDRVQSLMLEFQHQARQGNLQALASVVERRTVETFELSAARAVFYKQREFTEKQQAFAKKAGIGPLTRGKPTVSFSEGNLSESFIHSGTAGFVRAEPHGSALSGETRAALEFLCEQLASAVELCCAVEDKVRLERELAERERLAALGQMAASISHNLKNPLGSIKTILQVQLESPEMPDSLKAETQMVLAEISRLSGKLSQLLQFSRPAVLGDATASCDVSEIVKEVTQVLGHEFGGKGIVLEVSCNGSLQVAAAKEAVNDIVSNLVVNALEASVRGSVRITATRQGQKAVIQVEDDGKGIPSELREKVLQPFFTTKTQGTGLGLAIVAKRVAEANGGLELESPVADGQGTRFLIWLPLREEGR